MGMNWQRHSINTQMLCFFISFISQLIVIAYTKARLTRLDLLIDYLNEIKHLLIMYHFILFTPFVFEAWTKIYIGYSCNLFIFMGLSVNLFMLFVQPVVTFKRKSKLRYAKKQRKMQIAEKKEVIRASAKKFHRRHFQQNEMAHNCTPKDSERSQ